MCCRFFHFRKFSFGQRDKSRREGGDLSPASQKRVKKSGSLLSSIVFRSFKTRKTDDNILFENHISTKFPGKKETFSFVPVVASPLPPDTAIEHNGIVFEFAPENTPAEPINTHNQAHTHTENNQGDENSTGTEMEYYSACDVDCHDNGAVEPENVYPTPTPTPGPASGERPFTYTCANTQRPLSSGRQCSTDCSSTSSTSLADVVKGTYGHLGLSNYEIGEEIGVGCFAHVYLATDIRTGMRVALKAVDKTRADKDKLYLEVEALKKAQTHPNVIKLYDVFEDETHLYLSTEYCPNGNLHQYLIKHGPLGEEHAKRWIAQLALAVKHCHDHGVINRDIKNANIFISGSMNLKLGDFGLAAIVKDANSDRLKSATGSAVFAAPEVYSAHRSGGYYPIPSEIWGIGAVLHSMLTLRLPFDVDRYQEQWGLYVPPMRVSNSCSRLLRRIFQLDPHVRPSLNEFLLSEWVAPATERIRQIYTTFYGPSRPNSHHTSQIFEPITPDSNSQSGCRPPYLASVHQINASGAFTRSNSTSPTHSGRNSVDNSGKFTVLRRKSKVATANGTPARRTSAHMDMARPYPATSSQGVAMAS
eukprot:comp22397_c2_seq2/m.33439 comp22397_c2_seq2/g.33439  ORF comp22397_c2_seq2/g.33439 comp22397_c2_seq2/m.33439 type:complete len:590 (-) comp22397_c2_seq2:122-1891(-)